MNIGNQVPTISSGFPTPSQWNNAARILNILRSIGLGPGMTGMMNNSGVFLDAKGGVEPTRAVAGPWQLTMTAAPPPDPMPDPPTASVTVGITDCYSWRGGLTRLREDPVEVTIPVQGTGGKYYIGVEMDDNSDTTTIIHGSSLGDATFAHGTVLENNDTRSRRLLYILESTGAGYDIYMDARTQMMEELYG